MGSRANVTGTDGSRGSDDGRTRTGRLVSKVKDLVKEGNVRRIVVKNSEGTSVLEVPVTAAVLGTVILPAVVAVGAIAGLSKDWTLEVYRKDPGAAG